MTRDYSYHDLHITTPTIERTAISKLPFLVQVLCTRAAGWEVWLGAAPPSPETLLGGEFDLEKPLRLDINGFIIVDSMSGAEEQT